MLQRREQRDLAVSTGSPELGRDMEVLKKRKEKEGRPPFGSARDKTGVGLMAVLETNGEVAQSHRGR